ncbi:hypothetical protein RND81_13G191400 [Saponaria officinalis]|uniref:Transcriptional coactivator Hfi1/Transcriptional adapter 1 n=1 Tax=Saponaria officinalis TaxID=3572 RepID=A0AAW1H4S5_SAPOF
MPGDGHINRINILEIKIQIGKKLGTQKAQKYFDLLNRFFTHKLGKSEFDKLCFATVGRENICLHNRLIRSILKNAFLSKTPPPKANNVEKPDSNKVSNGYQRSCLQSLCRDVFPPSPRKGRTHAFRDRKAKDRPSPLGPHGKPNNVVAIKESPTELLSLGSRPIEVNSVEDGEEVDQAAISPGIHSRSPVTPPLGVPWNGKGNRKVFNSLSSSIHIETCQRNGELPETSSLKKRLEQKLEKEGMRVSVDCVNLLNNGLDTFLKRLIKPSLELTISRVGNKGLHQMNGQTTSTMLDFRTAMELTPQILGEDWPLQLENVCLRDFENVNGD